MKHPPDDAADSGEEPAAGWPAGDQKAEGLLRLIHWTSAAGRQLRRRLADVAAEFDLTDTELLVVWLCSGSGRVQVELAGSLGVSPAQMSGLAERLRSRGLVAMHRPALDRRRQIWLTTGSGAALLERVAGHLDAIAAEIADALADDQQRSAQSLCQRLAEAVAASGKRASSRPGERPGEASTSREAA